MAWPKLRNKSSGPLMTESKRSGAAHDGARSQGKEAEGAPEGPARLPFLRAQRPRKTEAAGGSAPGRGAPGGARGATPAPPRNTPRRPALGGCSPPPPAESSAPEPSAGEPSTREPSGGE